MTPEFWVAIGLGSLSIFLIVKYSRKKKPVWGYETRRIIGLGSNAPPELKLFFNNKIVEDVYETKVIFLNRGNDVIRKEDVSDNITIEFKGCKVLREPSLVPNRDVIRFTQKLITKEEYSLVQLDFLYLDHNDGAVVEVLHTKCEEITCSGNIIGTEIGEFKGYDERSRSFVRNREAVMGTMLLTTIGFVLFVEPTRKEPARRMLYYVLTLKEAPTMEGITMVAMLAVAFSMFIYGMVRYIRCRALPKWIQDAYVKAD